MIAPGGRARRTRSRWEEIVVDDIVHGRVVFQNSELDDLIVARSAGTPAHTFQRLLPRVRSVTVVLCPSRAVSTIRDIPDSKADFFAITECLLEVQKVIFIHSLGRLYLATRTMKALIGFATAIFYLASAIPELCTRQTSRSRK
jgi:hypothetical protein